MPVDVGSHYSVILVSVEDWKIIDPIAHKTQSELETLFPDAVINVKKFSLGPGSGGKIQLRINGPDPAELRRMAEKAKAIIDADPDTKAVRDEWGEKVKTVRPVLAEDRARRLGIDRTMVSQMLQATYSGTLAGVYRDYEGRVLLNIGFSAFPEESNDRFDNPDDLAALAADGKSIAATTIGYIQAIGHEAIVKAACQAVGTVELEVRPGHLSRPKSR